MFETGDIKNFDLLYFRLRQNLEKCFFFEEMPVFSEEARKNLSVSMRNKLEEEWKGKLMSAIYEDCLWNHDPSLWDIWYLLNKERLVSDGKLS